MHQNHNRFGGHGSDRPEKIDLEKMRKQIKNRQKEDGRILLARINELDKELGEKNKQIRELETDLEKEKSENKILKNQVEALQDFTNQHAGFLAMHGMIPYKQIYVCPKCGETTVEESTSDPSMAEQMPWTCSNCKAEWPNHDELITAVKEKLSNEKNGSARKD